MGKKFFFLLVLLISSVAYADSYKQIQNPWTGKPDYVTKVDGMGITVSSITIQPPGTTISGNYIHISTPPAMTKSNFVGANGFYEGGMPYGGYDAGDSVTWQIYTIAAYPTYNENLYYALTPFTTSYTFVQSKSSVYFIYNPPTISPPAIFQGVEVIRTYKGETKAYMGVPADCDPERWGWSGGLCGMNDNNGPYFNGIIFSEDPVTTPNSFYWDDGIIVSSHTSVQGEVTSDVITSTQGTISEFRFHESTWTGGQSNYFWFRNLPRAGTQGEGFQFNIKLDSGSVDGGNPGYFSIVASTHTNPGGNYDDLTQYFDSLNGFQVGFAGTDPRFMLKRTSSTSGKFEVQANDFYLYPYYNADFTTPTTFHLGDGTGYQWVDFQPPPVLTAEYKLLTPDGTGADQTIITDLNASFHDIHSSSGTAQNICWARGNYTITNNCDVTLASTTSAGFTLTMPDATAKLGATLYIKKVDLSTGTITISPVSSQTIDGSTQTYQIHAPKETRMFMSDGANWRILN